MLDFAAWLMALPALLEKDIGQRRPQYAEYVRRTNAFLPGPPR